MANKVLLIEDNVIISKSIEQKLKEEMYDVKSVFNGEDEVHEVNKNDYDVILLD